MRSFLRDLGGRDPYDILGVPRTATTDEIVAAHRRLVRTLHPDSPTGDAEAATLLNVARDILSDPVARAEYDRFAAQRAAAGAEGPAAASGTRVTEDTAAPAGEWAEKGGWKAYGTTGPGAAESPSAWDGQDVFTGAVRSPNASWRAPPTPAHYPRYVRRPPGVGLGVTALVFSVTCTPVGLILGLVGLGRYSPGSTGRTCSIVAVVVSAISCLAPLLVLLVPLLGGQFAPADLPSSPTPTAT